MAPFAPDAPAQSVQCAGMRHSPLCLIEKRQDHPLTSLAPDAPISWAVGELDSCHMHTRLRQSVWVCGQLEG